MNRHTAVVLCAVIASTFYIWTQAPLVGLVLAVVLLVLYGVAWVSR